MTIENEVNMIIPYQAIFNEKFIVERKNLLLNSIKIYEVHKSLIGNNVDFEIKVIDGKIVVYPLSTHNKFMLTAKRVFNATVLKINKEDCISMIEDDKEYKFVIE